MYDNQKERLERHNNNYSMPLQPNGENVPDLVKVPLCFSLLSSPPLGLTAGLRFSFLTCSLIGSGPCHLK